MSKGLEALQNIREEAGTPYFSSLYDIDMWREDFATVEKELKKPQELYNALLVKRLNLKQTRPLTAFKKGAIQSLTDTLKLIEEMFEVKKYE